MDFGVQWNDGDMLMRPTGDVHAIHLGRDSAEGWITRWSRSGGVRTTHLQGTRQRVLAEWGRLKGFCFHPGRRDLDMVRFPQGED